MTELNGGGGVVYTVKELLGNLDQKLDAVIAKLDGKVDQRAFDELKQRVKVLEDRASNSEAAKQTAETVAATLVAKDKADRSFWEQWRAKFAWGLGLAVALGTLHQSFPHFF